MQTLKSIRLANLIGITSTIILSALFFNLISPTVNEGASAEEVAEVNARIAPVMSIALTNEEINIELTPTGESVMETSSTTVTVNTNNSTGYALYLNTLGEDASLTNIKNSIDKIAPMVGTELIKAPLNFEYGGDYYDSTANYVGYYGGYWTSTAINSSTAYSQVFNYSSTNMSNSTKKSGRNIRCLTR